MAMDEEFNDHLYALYIFKSTLIRYMILMGINSKKSAH